jgi:hypothetical protein
MGKNSMVRPFLFPLSRSLAGGQARRIRLLPNVFAVGGPSLIARKRMLALIERFVYRARG